MMKHARSERRRFAREEAGVRKPEKIGSRVFPLRGPPAPMPTVGTRRSTRAFVRKSPPKAPQDGDSGAARVLRSGKRLMVSKPVGEKPGGDGDGDAYEWMGFFGGSGDVEDTNWWKGKKGGLVPGKGGKEGHKVEWRRHAKEGRKVGGELPNNILKEGSAAASLCGRAFGIVYSRKRRRSGPDGSDSFCSQPGLKDSKGWSNSVSGGLCSSSSIVGGIGMKDRRYGISFARKPRSKKPKLSSLVTGRPKSAEFSADKGIEMTETMRCFAQKLGISERSLGFGSIGRVVLVALVHSTHGATLHRFACFLVSILSGMMKEEVNLSEWAAFASSRLAASLLSLQGVHFLPLRHWKSDFSHRIALSDTGFCIIFGTRLFMPLVSVNFSALPFLFKSWHLSIFLSSIHLPTVPARHQRQWRNCADTEVSFEERRLYDSHICVETGTSKVEMEIMSFGTPVAEEIDVVCDSQNLPAKEVSSITGASESAVRNNPVTSGIKFRKRRRKRGLLRSGSVSRRSLLKSRRNSLLDAQNGMLKVDTRVKVHPVHEGCELGPADDKPLDSYLGKVGTEQHALPSPTSPNLKRRRSMIRSSMPRIKESKSAFADARQNIDLLSCSANILVVDSDRCWREEGAKVMLELSSSNEWCLAVKFGDTTRFLHKAQEMNPSSSNRHTHAIMWTSETGWKLEFCDKNDWNVFKEMHKVCCERNEPEVPVRIIPVPGVQEVSGYEENFVSSFMRPDSYIHMVNDEVDRVLMSENACYDMDSEDEEWLGQLNSRALSVYADISTLISKDNFEKIISAFEKAAYNHLDDVSDQEKAVSLCSQFGEKGMVASVFDYWMKKRKQKHLPLIRVFQGQPPRKRLLTQKPLLRKRRSFKRQGSHVGRGKPDIFFEAAAKEDAVRKLQAAEAAASRAIDIAIRLRSRAQVLMTNADLATYKCVMALRLAESIQEAESPDLSSSILG